jgi:ferredoxin
VKVLKQDNGGFIKFLGSILKKYELIAPVNGGIIKFEKVKSAGDICLGKKSYFPAKEYFFKKQDTLFQFNGSRFIPTLQKPQKRVFFGLRKCDLNAIMRQDKIFIDGAHDPYYAAARQNSLLIGYHCSQPDSEHCFCGSMGLADFFDIMYYEKNGYYMVETGSEKGRKLVQEFRKYFVASGSQLSYDDRQTKGTDRLHKNDISGLYGHPDWKKGFEICLSCTACTALCPTCYCFEIHDGVSAKNPGNGSRQRQWSSCMLQEFTKVAKGHVYRKGRVERFKHRIYHQLDYFKGKHGINLCVGCGRCIEGCPTRIDFVRIINEMK